MNYGETLVYWYLRLNGFFPLVDFVLHHHDETIAHSADCDVLAVRHPHTYEVIGGHTTDWDPKLSDMGIRLDSRIIGIIVEVKTGQNTAESRENIRRSFSNERNRYAVQRLGFWPQDNAARIANSLNTEVSYQDDTYQIFKLLVADKLPPVEQPEKWKQLSLKQVETFIIERFKKYQDQKHPDRLRFPSDLMQYMIWKSSNRR